MGMVCEGEGTMWGWCVRCGCYVGMVCVVRVLCGMVLVTAK